MINEENTLNFDLKVQEEIAEFIKAKTGCKSFVLGISDSIMPCEGYDEVANPEGCGHLHRVEAFADGVLPKYISNYTYTVYQCLAQEEDKKTNPTPQHYEPSSTH